MKERTFTVYSFVDMGCIRKVVSGLADLVTFHFPKMYDTPGTPNEWPMGERPRKFRIIIKDITDE